MAGGRHTDGPASGLRSGTPRGELARVEEIRGKTLDAMLAACGQKGYRRVAVQDVIDRYGGNRVQFYRHFSSKADCYAAAYEDEVERLEARVVKAGDGD